MKYRVKFYARLRGEVIERIVDAPDLETAKIAVKPYGSSEEDIVEIIELWKISSTH